MGNCCNIFLKEKHIADDFMVYYTIKSLEDKEINNAYNILSKKYKDHNIFIVNSNILSKLIDKRKTIFIYSNVCDNKVLKVEIYD
jgi:hypothetical protein